MDYVIVTIAIAISGLCEFISAVVLNLPVSVVSTMADEGSSVGLRLKHTLDEPVETQLAVRLVDMVVLIGAVISLATMFTADGRTLYVETAVLAAGISVLKIALSVLGERVSDKYLVFTSNALSVMTTVTTPLLLARRGLLALTKPRTQEEEEEEAREELEALVETARDEGALDPGEYRIMTNIMQLSSIEVTDVMTPRTVVAGLASDMTVADAIKRPELQTFSRMPVYEGADLDTVTGYVMTKDILRAAVAGRQTVEIGRLKRDIGYIPENITLDHALEQFLQQRQHVFMVVDEHGGVEGIITMEDVLETMLGAEIVDEADHVVDLRALAKQRRDARVARITQS
jgi:CBS domain containing-hemolysin-like protein